MLPAEAPGAAWRSPQLAAAARSPHPRVPCSRLVPICSFHESSWFVSPLVSGGHQVSCDGNPKAQGGLCRLSGFPGWGLWPLPPGQHPRIPCPVLSCLLSKGWGPRALRFPRPQGGGPRPWFTHAFPQHSCLCPGDGRSPRPSLCTQCSPPQGLARRPQPPCGDAHSAMSRCYKPPLASVGPWEGTPIPGVGHRGHCSPLAAPSRSRPDRCTCRSPRPEHARRL